MRLGLLAAGVALVLGWAPSGTGAHPPLRATGASPAYAPSRHPHHQAPAANELVLEHGRAVAVHNPYLSPDSELPRVANAARVKSEARVASAPRAARAPRARAASTGAPSVSVALKSLESGAAITPQQHAQYLSDYEAAAHSLTKLTGTRHTELGAVIANLQAMAAAGDFIPSRLPVLFDTLDANRAWWTTGPLLSSGQHVAFSDSKLVWEYYPGQGIEIQWLATFGEANGFYSSGTQNSSLSQVLQEMIPLATQRAGGIAWEYLFNFDGGAPPWTSGLSQGTAIQALARGWSRLHTQAYLTAAQQALGLFQTPPPAGVRVATPAGATYLQYSFAPSERIINGFVQSLVGLYDYTSLTGDPIGEQLFSAGDAEARVEVPDYDTGAWSMYDQSSESDLSYHDLLTTFLTNLCQRTEKTVTPLSLAPRDAVSESVKAKAQAHSSRASSHATGANVAPGAVAAPVGATGGSGATGTTTPTVDPDMVYCQAAAHFTSYLKIKPVLKLLTTKLQGGRSAPLQYTLSKISNVSVAVTMGKQTLLRNGGLIPHGTHFFDWTPPKKKPGVYTVTLTATDLAGNVATISGPVTVTPPPKPKPKPKPKGKGTSTTTTTSTAHSTTTSSGSTSATSTTTTTAVTTSSSSKRT